MLKVIACLVFFISSFLSFSQTIQGRIVDEKGQAVPYAHLQFDKSTVGTISNDSGFFSLQKKKDFAYLNISAIGFKSLKIPPQQLLKERYTFVMQGSQITMEEVVVKGTFDSATWYVQQAIKNIPKNYPKKKHSQIAFYRESTIRDTTYARMLKAIVLLSERGINRKSEDTKYEVLQMRKTADNRNISWRQSLSQWLYVDFGPYFVNKSNPTKPKGPKNSDFKDFLLCNAISDDRKEQPTRLLYEKLLAANTFEIQEQYFFEGKYYVEIKSEMVDTVKYGFTKYVKPYLEMVICKDDMAVVQFEKFELTVKDSYFSKNNIKDDLRSHYLIKWRKNEEDGRYYVKYIRDASVGSNASQIFGGANTEEVYKTKGASGFMRQANEWYVLENRDYEQISWREGASQDEDMYEITPSKRLGFSFESINALPISPINQKMLNELSQNGSIDALFIED